MKNMKGQFTIVALVMTFVAIIVFIAIYPVLNTFIQQFLAESEDATLNMLVQLLPFFILLGIVLGIIFYIVPQRQVVAGGY